MSPEEFRKLFPVLTKHFTDDDCRTLLGALVSRTFPAGSTLTRYGELGHALHLVLSGSISIHVERQGEDLLLGQAGPGCVVGEIGLVEPGPSSASLQALDAVETLALEHDRFETLCDEAPTAASALLRALSLELVHRLRYSSDAILRRVGDHQWMRVQAEEDRPGWFGRVAALVRGVTGDNA